MGNDENKQKKEFAERFAAFMDKKGLNSNKLTTQLGGTNPVKYRRWAAGEVLPNAKGLRPICIKYGVSMDWLMSGIGQMDAVTTSPDKAVIPVQATTDPKIEEVTQENERLKNENEELRARLKIADQEVRDVRKEVAEMTRDIVEITKMSFNGSSSQFTAMYNQYQEEVRQQIGFRQTLIKAFSPKVDRFHPYVRYQAPKALTGRIRITD